MAHSAKIAHRMHQNTPFSTRKVQIFSGEGQIPSQDSFPSEEGDTPFLHPTVPLGASTLAPLALDLPQSFDLWILHWCRA